MVTRALIVFQHTPFSPLVICIFLIEQLWKYFIWGKPERVPWLRARTIFMHAWWTRGALQSVQEQTDARSDRQAAEQHEQKLARRREKDRAKRRSETAEDREKRLVRRREQAKRQSERAEDRGKRLARTREQTRAKKQSERAEDRGRDWLGA